MTATDTRYPCRRLYLDTPEGQVHVRRYGVPDGRPLILLHWTPGSGAMLAHVATALGEKGHDVWAPDMLGFGLSDKPDPSAWSQARHGQALADGLRQAGLTDIVMHGGHMGGEVAMEAAIHAPDIISHVILDGIATDWSPAQREEIVSQIAYEPPAYDEAGAPLSWGWEKTLWLWKAWAPNLIVDGPWIDIVHQAMTDIMLTSFEPGAMRSAFTAYHARERLPRITQPVLALTADSDTLRPQFPSTVAALGSVKAHVFDGIHPCHRPDGGADYADIVDAYVRSEARGWLSAEDDLAPTDTATGYDDALEGRD